MTLSIDLNCDLGESFGRYTIGNDEEILKYITSANIACGFHAGDPGVMHKTVQLALRNNVAIGAHPGFPDLAGFGRRNLHVSPKEIYQIIIYQVGALQAFIHSEGGTMQHVKPHGALYNMAAGDEQIATAIAEAIYAVDSSLILYGLAGSELIKAGKKVGLKTASEVFADRTYQKSGLLTSRSKSNALIEDKAVAVSQVLQMIQTQTVTTLDGDHIPIMADTVCIHGDGAQALIFAQTLHQTLQQEKVGLASFANKHKVDLR